MKKSIRTDVNLGVGEALDEVKRQQWFYEFDLPDGSRTDSYLPEMARQIHVTRRNALCGYLSDLGDDYVSALDISCHEGFFSLVLADYFASVVGLDRNAASLKKAALISDVLGCTNIRFENSSLEDWEEARGADFVLCFGLLYHVENPIQIIRKLAALAGKALCIETQVLAYDLTGSIEDGSYLWQRELQGLFGLCLDYSDRAEGGLTDLALVPSPRALEFLLRQFGFRSVRFYTPEPDDYEQFVRKQRVIILAEK